MKDRTRSTPWHLVELARLQQRAFSALLALNAAGPRPPDELYERYLGLARRLLEEATRYEVTSPAFFDLQGFALPLVQQLSIYADHRRSAGDADGAERLRGEADKLTGRYLAELATARMRRSRAMDAAAEGRFHDALIELKNAADVFTRDGDVLEVVQTELRLANVYEWLGDHERALDTLEKAHKQVENQLSEGPPSARDVASAIRGQIFSMLSQGRNTHEGEDSLALRNFAYEVLQAQARSHRALGDYVTAERLFLQARPFVVEMGLSVAVDYHLAVIACARKAVDQADRLTTEIAPAFEQPETRPRRGAMRALQADVQLLRAAPQLALLAAEEGLADQATYPDLDLAWKLHWRRAQALAGLDRYEEALAAYREAMGAADRLRMAPLGYRLDTTFLRDKLPLAHEAIDLALRRHDADAVAWFVELIKSRALSAILSVPRSPLAGRTADEVRFDEVSRKIDALAFARYSGSAPPGALRQRLTLLAERDALLEDIRIRDPRWRTMTEPSPIDLDAIRARLGKRAVLVLFQKGNQLVAVAIDVQGARASAKDLEPQTVDAIAEFVENLRKPVPDEVLFDLSGDRGVSLEDLIPTDVIERVTHAATLVVVPHGVLHLLPWACLAVGEQRLFERAAVGVLPNLASLLPLDSTRAENPAVALIGAADYSGLVRYPALTESPLELRDLQAIYADRVVSPTLTGRDATEAAFWLLAAACEGSDALLHFSGHGTLEATEPLASGLVLTDSTLDAAELLSRRLPYREVVLSACSTAWRPQVAHDLDLLGDDALGLPASFLEAGAGFLMANVSPVREKASRTFTVAWHRHRHSGLTPLQAYRAAQLEAYTSNPGQVFAWAGTTAYGCR